MSPAPWPEGYVAGFHADRPGITEQVLSRARFEGVDPYRWCAAALGRAGGLALDLACGSGPLGTHLPLWVGLDNSVAELAVATAAGRGPLLRADVAHLPIRRRTVGSVASSMALQVVEPLEQVIAEVARVLRPGGRMVALLPASRPLSRREALVYLRLQVALRQRITYPNTRRLRPAPLAKLVEAAGLSVTSDERRGFALPLRTERDAREVMASLYLPEAEPAEIDRATAVLVKRVGHDLTIPLRRVVLHRNAP